jgi:hypothetical protein
LPYVLLTTTEQIIDSPHSGGDESPSTEGHVDWSSNASSVDGEKPSPFRRGDVYVLPEPWQARRAEERARSVRASPLRAEDEILRIQYSSLKKRVAELEAREAQRLLGETKSESGSGVEPTGSKKCKSTEDVWFTTLEEVSADAARDSSTPARAEREDDRLDALTEKLFMEALEDDSGGSEMFG